MILLSSIIFSLLIISSYQFFSTKNSTKYNKVKYEIVAFNIKKYRKREHILAVDVANLYTKNKQLHIHQK